MSKKFECYMAQQFGVTLYNEGFIPINLNPDKGYSYVCRLTPMQVMKNATQFGIHVPMLSGKGCWYSEYSDEEILRSWKSSLNMCHPSAHLIPEDAKYILVGMHPSMGRDKIELLLSLHIEESKIQENEQRKHL